VLDRLRVLAEVLAKAYGWTPAQASIFVLCGVTPFIATVRITRSSAEVRHHADLDWARRITSTSTQLPPPSKSWTPSSTPAASKAWPSCIP
jgi:hypothetical protein